MIEAIQLALLRICLLVVAVSLVALALRSKLVRDAFAQLLSVWRGMTALGRMVAVMLFSVCIIYGGTKTNSPPLRIVRPLPALRTIAPATVSEDEVGRGFRQVCVATNENASFAMPSNGTVVGNWHMRGTFGEWMRLELGGFAFPLGTNDDVCTSFSVFSDGRIRPTPRDTAREICAAGVPMLAVQGVSRFWTAGCADGSKLLTWEQFFLNGDTNVPVNAQIRLWPNGDFSTSSNGVETAYARICPYDWDGDGLPNGADANPCSYDGDFSGPANSLPGGACSNAYCTVFIVATGPDTLVTFTGDRPSSYPDPCFIARHGVTNEVVILMGKTYSVSPCGAVEVVGSSDPDTEIGALDGGGTQVCRPVSIDNSDGTTFTMLVSPAGLGGVFSWLPTGCGCTISGSGDTFSFTCPSTCTCCGTAAEGVYTYEGYSLPVTSCLCGCYYDGTGPEWSETEGPMAASVSATFSKSAVIFENAYENQPGQWVPKNSTRTRLNIVANGGPNGATLSVTQANISKLASISGPGLPLASVSVPAQTQVSYSIVYEGAEASGAEEDIVVSASVTDSGTYVVSSNECRATSIRLELAAIYEAPANPCTNRHVYGVGEKVLFKVRPQLVSVELSTTKLDVGDDFGEYELFNGAQSINAGQDRVYTCPISRNLTPHVRVRRQDAEYEPSIEIVEPHEVITLGAGWGYNAVDDFYVGNRKCWPSGCVGEATLVTTNYIGPMTVSFMGIAVSELPCDEEDTVTGCFTNGHSRTHTIQAGAGKAYYVSSNNFWFVDAAGSRTATTNWTPDSTLVWKIPIGWHRKIDGYTDWHGVYGPDYECFADIQSRPLVLEAVYRQSRHIDFSGVFRTEKYGHWISRSPSCCVILDGNTLQGSHPLW